MNWLGTPNNSCWHWKQWEIMGEKKNPVWPSLCCLRGGETSGLTLSLDTGFNRFLCRKTLDTPTVPSTPQWPGFIFCPQKFWKNSSCLVCHALLIDENCYALTFWVLSTRFKSRAATTRNIDKHQLTKNMSVQWRRKRWGGATRGRVRLKCTTLWLFERTMVTKMALRVSYSQHAALRVQYSQHDTNSGSYKKNNQQSSVLPIYNFG